MMADINMRSRALLVVTMFVLALAGSMLPASWAHADDLAVGTSSALKAQSDSLLVAPQSTASKIAGANLSVSAYVQKRGWKAAVGSGEIAGTTGKSLRIEGLKIKKTDTDLSGSVYYQTYVRNVGWQAAVKNGAEAGMPGQGPRIEAIKVWLTGDLAKNYGVLYRTYVKNEGWTPWSKNRGVSGAIGRGLHVQAVEIALTPKTAAAAGASLSKPSIRYDAHVQNIGWQPWVADGKSAGTSGKALRVEGFNFMLSPGKYSGGIKYKSHVQNIGWQKWVSNGAMTGTKGRSLRVEALRIKLTGKIAKYYDVYYRVHAENIGWLDWAKNGQMAGTSGCAYRLEAVQVKLVKKGSKAPGATAIPYAVGRWAALEAQYRNDKSVRQLLEVKYTGGSEAWVVLRQKKGKTWTTALSCKGYVGSDGIGQAREWIPRTPEGDFGITQAFGINGNPGSKLRYVQVDSSMYWCSDEAWYNQLIDINEYPHQCTGEHLIDYAPHYNYGLFFDYNTNPTVYGAGSAFFVHCTGGSSYTGGCVAVSQANMIKIIRTVSPGARLLIYPN